MLSRLLATYFILISSGHAFQTKHVEENGLVLADIAKSDIVRIFVSGDRIKSVKGIKGQYHLSSDEKTGDIYLRPQSSDTAINLFVTTEQNKTYQLKLSPILDVSDTIMIQPKQLVEKLPSKFRGSLYEKNLISFIKKIIVTFEGYKDRQNYISTHSLHYKLRYVTVFLDKTFRQGTVSGEVYTIQNNTNLPVRLSESMFYRKSVRAVSLKDRLIAANGVTNAYVVVEHE